MSKQRLKGQSQRSTLPNGLQSDNFCFVCINGLYQFYHTLNRTVITDLCGLHIKGTELIDSSAGNTVSGTFINRKGFTRHNSLIDGGLAG